MFKTATETIDTMNFYNKGVNSNLKHREVENWILFRKVGDLYGEGQICAVSGRLLEQFGRVALLKKPYNI